MGRWLRLGLLAFVVLGLASGVDASRTYGYDASTIARVHVHAVRDVEVSPAQLKGTPEVSAFLHVAVRCASTTFLARNLATEAAGTGGIETTAHGATRIAGEAATRGGVLSEAEIGIVREAGTVYNQGNGAIARVLQQADGRFSVVVDGDRGLITTFQNLSQNSLDRLAKNYGWELP